MTVEGQGDTALRKLSIRALGTALCAALALAAGAAPAAHADAGICSAHSPAAAVRCQLAKRCLAKAARPKRSRKDPCRAGAGAGRTPAMTPAAHFPAPPSAPAPSAPGAAPAAPGAAPAAPAAAGPAPASAPTVPDAAAAPGALRLFAPDSVWNAPLAANAPLDPSSPQRSAAFAAEIRHEITTGVGPWISETRYSTPLYQVPADQPRVKVKLDNVGSWGQALIDAFNQGVPIPDGAKPAVGTDGHLTIYQPSTDTLWEFWRAVKRTDGWHASWGGAMQHVSKSPGYYTNASWPGLDKWTGWNWGATATSLPVIAGTVRIDELRAGHIDHALAIDVPAPCKTQFSWPAQRTDGYSTDANCLPEGAHLRLDPSLDLSKLSMPPITRMLAVAAQRYGMVVRDMTGSAVSFYAEDPTPLGVNPYRGPDGFYGGLEPWNFLPKFPWGSVQLLQMSVCTKAPCQPPAAPAAPAGSTTTVSAAAAHPASSGHGAKRRPRKRACSTKQRRVRRTGRAAGKRAARTRCRRR